MKKFPLAATGAQTNCRSNEPPRQRKTWFHITCRPSAGIGNGTALRPTSRTW